MTLFEHPLYQEDLRLVASFSAIPWEKLKGASLLLSGATGMIGSLLVDTIHFKNETEGLNCRVIALGRNEAKARRRFVHCWDSPFFQFVDCDINKAETMPADAKADYILGKEYSMTEEESRMASEQALKQAESRSFQEQRKESIRQGGIYKVKSGDTLGKIARKFGTTVAQLCRTNKISAKTPLRAGQILRY